MTTPAASLPRTLIDVLPSPAHEVGRLARDGVLVAGFAVLTALFAQIRIDLGFTPVPITGQTFAVLLAGAALGWRRGALSQAVYWVAGIFMPVAWYAGDDSGSSVHAGWKLATGTTAGYLAGFILAAALVGYLAERKQDRDFATSVPAMLAGTAVIYACGVVWLAHYLNIPVSPTGDGETNAISLGLTPFLVGDTLKLLLAGALTPLAWEAVERFEL
jgi:biotin transport system substrate-specific component